MKTCVFAGTFDPPTIGHADMVGKCLELFDRVVVAVGKNPSKTPYFTLEERLSLVNKVFKDNENVEVVAYQGMLVDLLKDYDTKFTVRGIRNEDDFKYETTMAYYNEDMFPEAITIFLPTPQRLSHISSTALRDLIRLDADFSHYIPECIATDIKRIIYEKEQKSKQ